jgi:hypothetical protein
MTRWTNPVHLSGLNSVSPLRTWAGLGEFLVSTLEEYSSCWGAGGRRVGALPVPEEAAEPELPLAAPFPTTGLDTLTAASRSMRCSRSHRPGERPRKKGHCREPRPPPVAPPDA